MNVYDFDGTIYYGDSTADFIGFCVRRYPKTLLWLPITAWSFLLYILGVYTKTQFKERMYGFLRYVPDGAEEMFWQVNKSKIKPWYFEQQKEDDVVISASPEFLIKPICAMIGIRTAMASRVDRHTGITDGENCHDVEKVRRLHEWNESAQINEFYSDSTADEPLASIAKNAFMVKGNKLIEWQSYKPDGFAKFKKMFLSREFLSFVIVGAINTLSNIIFSTIYSLFIPSTTLAFFPGYITSNVVSYLLNSYLTFKERLGFVRFVKFFISYIPNFIIQTVIVWLFDRFVHGPAVIAYALAAVIGVPITFVFMKVFAFKKK